MIFFSESDFCTSITSCRFFNPGMKMFQNFHLNILEYSRLFICDCNAIESEYSRYNQLMRDVQLEYSYRINYGGIPCVHNVLFYVPLCYLLFSMTDLYRGKIGRGVSKFDSALWEINSVVLKLSASLHQLCVLWEHQRCLSLRNYFFCLHFKMPIKNFLQKYNCSWLCEKYNEELEWIISFE